ncbi:MAG: Rap1a immunity protein [Gammaproteobacteria bacterium]|jgi:hypothetical protein|nr:Rap1a immunity protein [Gammaproteobacteria bacterium]
MLKQIIVITFLSAINYAYADSFESGNQLLPYCQAAIRTMDAAPDQINPEDNLQGSQCLGYIDGAVDAYMDVLEISNPKGAKKLNNEMAGVNSAQLIRMYVNYLTDNPQISNHTASSLILSMIMQQFNT